MARSWDNVDSQGAGGPLKGSAVYAESPGTRLL